MLSEAERNNQLQIIRPNGAIFFIIVGINGMPLYEIWASKISLFWQHKPQTGMTVILTYLLTYLLHGAEPFLRSYLVLQLFKKFPAFLEPEGSSPYSQVPATCPYPEPTPSSTHNPLPLPEGPF